jgi:hypothetical protein
MEEEEHLKQVRFIEKGGWSPVVHGPAIVLFVPKPEKWKLWTTGGNKSLSTEISPIRLDELKVAEIILQH